MLQDRKRVISATLFASMLMVSLFLVLERQGWLPWAGVVLGGVGLVLMAVLHGRNSLYCFGLFSSVLVIAWAGVASYVFSTWESGEVVEILIAEPDSKMSFRTWVVDRDGTEIAIYECPPEARSTLESNEVVLVDRQTARYTAELDAVPAERLNANDLNEIYALFREKYGDKSRATKLYYLLMGARRDSQVMVLFLNRKDV
jgi:hypothetical protein